MSLLTLKNRETVPPKGFRHVCPATGARLSGPSYSVWLAKVREHYDANGMEYPGDAEIEDELCRMLPPEWVSVPPRTGPQRVINWPDVAHFLSVATNWLGSGGQWVEQDEATRRAHICATCPENADIQGCPGCHGAANAIVGLIGERSTPYDHLLKGCSVCACSNKAQVHFPLEALHKGVTPAMKFPAHCWKKPS